MTASLRFSVVDCNSCGPIKTIPISICLRLTFCAMIAYLLLPMTLLFTLVHFWLFLITLLLSILTVPQFPSVVNAYIGLGKVLPIWRGGGTCGCMHLSKVVYIDM